MLTYNTSKSKWLQRVLSYSSIAARINFALEYRFEKAKRLSNTKQAPHIAAHSHINAEAQNRYNSQPEYRREPTLFHRANIALHTEWQMDCE